MSGTAADALAMDVPRSSPCASIGVGKAPLRPSQRLMC